MCQQQLRSVETKPSHFPTEEKKTGKPLAAETDWEGRRD
jgi:hypothetical protein